MWDRQDLDLFVDQRGTETEKDLGSSSIPRFVVSNPEGVDSNQQGEFNWICVCSDKSVAKQDKTTDNRIERVSGLGNPVTSDPKDIQDFLENEDGGVVFSTYQSSELVADSQKNPSTPAFDITFADEAHRCTGKISKCF